MTETQFAYEETLETSALNEDTLQRLSRLAASAKNAASEVASLEAALEAAKKQLTDLTEREIPSIMDEVGMADFRLSNGTRITVREEVRASIPAARKDEAIAWLDQHDLSGMVKRTFTIAFNRDEETWANKFEADLRKRKKEVRLKKEYKVEPMTLKAWASSSLKEGLDVPADLFGVFIQRRAKID